MAILKKRTSSKQLPEARGLDRAPLDSIIRGAVNTPSVSSSSSGRPFTSEFTNPAIKTPTSAPKTTLAPKTSLTTSTGTTPKTTLAPKTPLTSTTAPTTKPTVTNKTPSTPATKTTSPATTVKPTVKPNTSNPNSTTSKVVNALTGAAIGAGTKLLIDKFTGKPATSTSKPNVSTGTGTAANSTAAKTAAAATKAKADAVAAKAKADAVKPKAPTTSVVKPPVTNPSTGLPSGTGFGDEKEEFSTDSLGNTYKTMPDGTSVLYRSAEVAEDEFMTDSLGNVFKTMPDGTYELYRAAEVDEDYPPSTVAGNEEDTTVADNSEAEYYQDGDGNYYTMNADGGYDLAYYADGTEYSDDYTDDTEDATVADNSYYDEESGQTWNLSDSGMWTLEGDDSTYYDDSLYADNTDYTEDTDYLYAGNDYTDYDPYSDDPPDDYAKRGGLITMMKQGGVANFEDGGYVDNGDGTYSIGNFTYDMETDEYLYSTDAETGNISNVSPDAVYSTNPAEDYYDTDSLGNVFKNGEFYRAADVDEGFTSAGSGERPWYENLGNTLQKGFTGATKLGSDALSGITGALGTTAGAAGAGALVATLLGQDFGGGTGNQNQGLDMSQVGVINPRTTDFGVGPTRFVGYDDYGTTGGDYTPNAELLKNLNAPGYNPVNEGDYGYEEAPAEEAVQKKASGGLSSMATPVASYYTFGQPADILANLGMRPQPPMNPPEMMPQIGQQQSPQQTQQQGLPQQAPAQMAQQAPQGMPQQGMMPQQQGMPPPMRKGGLPHVSDVPMTQGRMDFRRGSAVHGAGDGQSDDIPAMLADGEYVFDADTVAQIGNGSTKAGAQALDKFRESIRAHKRSAPINKIPPKTKALTSYLKGAK